MSEQLAKELKQRGFNFCGPVIVYAFAQAIGMVNDHIVSCHRHAECERLALSLPLVSTLPLREGRKIASGVSAANRAK